MFPPDSGNTLPDNSPDTSGINETDGLLLKLKTFFSTRQVLKKSSAHPKEPIPVFIWDGELRPNIKFLISKQRPRASELIQSRRGLTQSNLTSLSNLITGVDTEASKGFDVNEARPRLHRANPD